MTIYISHPPKGPSRNGALLKLTLCRSSSQLSHFVVDNFLSSMTKILFFTNTTIYNNKLYSLPKKKSELFAKHTINMFKYGIIPGPSV